TILDNIVVEYGGSFNLRGGMAALQVFRSGLTITKAVVRNSSAVGVLCSTTAFTLLNGTVTDNALEGVSADNCLATIQSRDRSRSGSFPATVDPSSSLSGNIGSGNHPDAIGLRGGNITTNVTWAKQVFPYQVTGDVYVQTALFGGPPPVLTI